MTLLVVLLYGLGAVLVASAIETDHKTGRSVSITQTVQDIWNDTLDFSQPASNSSSGTSSNTSTTGGGTFTVAATAPNPSTSTLAAASYQNAAVAAYLQSHKQA